MRPAIEGLGRAGRQNESGVPMPASQGGLGGGGRSLGGEIPGVAKWYLCHSNQTGHRYVFRPVFKIYHFKKFLVRRKRGCFFFFGGKKRSRAEGDLDQSRSSTVFFPHFPRAPPAPPPRALHALSFRVFFPSISVEKPLRKRRNRYTNKTVGTKENEGLGLRNT